MTTTLCSSCTEAPQGEAGHGELSFYIEGPFPGHRIFRCASCDARWIRHYGSEAVRFAWTQFSDDLRTSRSLVTRRTLPSQLGA